MKRDMDLIRSILLAIEASDEESIGGAFEHLDCPEAVLHYHLGLLYSARFIEAIDGSSMDGAQYIPTGLTWAGHEFLDDIRDEGIWSKIKQTVRQTTGTVSLAVLQDFAKTLARAALGLPG